jgi:hypothetical protein
VGPAIDKGVAALKSGGVCRIDLRIEPGRRQSGNAKRDSGTRNL